MSYTNKAEGEFPSLEYALYFEKDGTRVSPFHDIPLWADKEKGILNMIVEIPRNTRAKLEVNKKTAFNPIKQDVKNGKLRYVEYGNGYMWNYGCLPQTWEYPAHKDADTGAFGDGDPVDVCEIGDAVAKSGEIIQVKYLGLMALIDEGETDWKIIAINVNDPLADKLNDIDDVEKYKPGYLHETYVWFRDYKGAPNSFAFDGKARDKAYAHKVIEENNGFWQDLISGKIPAKTEKYDVNLERATGH